MNTRPWLGSPLLAALAIAGLSCWPLHAALIKGGLASSSASADGSAAQNACDGERFSIEAGRSWKGVVGATPAWWQIDFGTPRRVGAILQILGDHEFVFRNAPRAYAWQWSEDGRRWTSIPGAQSDQESRLYRIHRFSGRITARFLRLEIRSCTGEFPTVREVEFYSEPRDPIGFPEWILAVNCTHETRLPNHGQEFITLARAGRPGRALSAQQINVGDFNRAFTEAEPRPLCAFLSGSFKDWCEVNRETWRGVQGILRKGRLPMWASCGGAQGLAIVAEYGVDRPWDCPHCRNPHSPKTPIYTHIGHLSKQACGDYSGCQFERGPHQIRQCRPDPIFRGLPEEFTAMESHCGQIEWPPRGWELIATAGRDTLTKTQCLRVRGRPIYAAQFHIEMNGAPASSRVLMDNFLELSRQWNFQGRH